MKKQTIKTVANNIIKGLYLGFGFSISIVICGYIYVYASSLTATSGEKLTADKWNNLVNKFNNCKLSEFSTSEILTGERWINGKPIYRKVIDAGYLPNTAAGSSTASTGLAGIAEFIVKYEGVQTNGTQFKTVTFDHSGSSQQNCLVYLDSIGNIYKYTQGAGYGTFKVWLTVYYTKIADTSSSPVSNICE